MPLKRRPLCLKNTGNRMIQFPFDSEHILFQFYHRAIIHLTAAQLHQVPHPLAVRAGSCIHIDSPVVIHHDRRIKTVGVPSLFSKECSILMLHMSVKFIRPLGLIRHCHRGNRLHGYLQIQIKPAIRPLAYIRRVHRHMFPSIRGS